MSQTKHKTSTPASPSTARLLLIAERALLRDALAESLARPKDFTIVAAVASVDEALEVVRRETVDVALLDAAHTHEALAAASRIAIEAPTTRVMFLDPWADSRRCRTAMESGMAAYFDQRQSLVELRTMVRSVLAGERATTPNLSTVRKPHFHPSSAGNGIDPGAINLLNSREREVLELLVRGIDMDTVAKQMKVSRSTVEHYRSRLLKQFGFRRFPELAYWLLTTGVL